MAPETKNDPETRTGGPAGGTPLRKPANSGRALLRFVGGYVLTNIQGALEYRLSFFTDAFSMLLSDVMWLVFWLAYFARFKVVAGWGQTEIVTLWAVVAAGFGLATAICGNLFRMARRIAQGDLDFYLALPKPVLPHLLVSRMEPTALGDVLFGLAGFGLITHPSAGGWSLFVLFVLTTAAIFIGFGVISQSLTFWLGQGEGLALQLTNAMISFSTYPTAIFRGAVKVALFTVLPAGFIAYVPVELLRRFSWPMFLGLLAFSGGILGLAWWVFHAGLRRYESGNLMLTRE